MRYAAATSVSAERSQKQIRATPCERCGKRCTPGKAINPNARMMRRAERGMCVECCVVDFLQRLSNMDGGRLLSGMPGEATPAALRLPHVQRQFERVMHAANSDATPAEIDWDRVVDVWCIAPREVGFLF